MRTRPILFNAKMVRALLKGQKTQTRRVLKAPFEIHGNGAITKPKKNPWGGIERYCNYPCPYGEIGDLLWVRETFGARVINRCGTGEFTVYRASDPDAVYCSDCSGGHIKMKWKPSIFMPRHLSRLTLKITDVRIEKVKDINVDDVLSEGIVKHHISDEFGIYGGKWFGNPVAAYKCLWNSINNNWDDNPWVWVLEFEVILQNVDAFII